MDLIQSLKEQFVQNVNDVYLFTLVSFQTQVLFFSVEQKGAFKES